MCFLRFHPWIVIKQEWEYDRSYVPPRRKLVDDVRFCPKCGKLQNDCMWGWSDYSLRETDRNYHEIMSQIQLANIQYKLIQKEAYKKYDPQYNIESHT